MITIPVNTDLRHFFDACLTIVNVVTRLEEKEKEVLSVLMLIDYTNRIKLIAKGVPSGKIDIFMDAFLLSTPVRKKIRRYLSPPLSENSFNNLICQLRKKKMLLNNRINKYLQNLYPPQADGTVCLTVSFEISAKI